MWTNFTPTYYYLLTGSYRRHITFKLQPMWNQVPHERRRPRRLRCELCGVRTGKHAAIKEVPTKSLTPRQHHRCNTTTHPTGGSTQGIKKQNVQHNLQQIAIYQIRNHQPTATVVYRFSSSKTNAVPSSKRAAQSRCFGNNRAWMSDLTKWKYQSSNRFRCRSTKSEQNVVALVVASSQAIAMRTAR